jgi:ADP-heptose:LPS heptosyltransferase
MEMNNTVMSQYKKIFVDGLMHMGDMIMSSSVFPLLKNAYPDAEITYLSMDNLADVAALLEGVDRVIPYSYESKGGYGSVYTLAQQLKRENYDIGISLDPRERVSIMKWLAHMPERVSMEQALGWKLGWEKYLYTKVISLEGWDTRQHRMSESFQEITCRFLGCTNTGQAHPSLKSSSKVDIDFIKQIFSQYPGHALRIGMCVETLEARRNWPAAKFAILLDQLCVDYDAQIIMTGIPQHEQTVQNILALMEHKENVLNMVGKTTIEQLAALFTQVDLTISLDTGTAHLAAAAGSPIVTIFTNSSPEIYQPVGRISHIVSAHLPCSGKYACLGEKHCPDFRCLHLVTVEMVRQEIDKTLHEIHLTKVGNQ